MSKQKKQVTTTLALPIAGATPTDDSSMGSNLVKKYIYHWPLFVLGVIIALVGAYFYLKKTNPVYPILATLEFKAPTASSASLTVNQSSTEQELDPINKPIIVENEIEVMQSKKLIYQVVNHLQLWVTYTTKKGLSTIDLYKGGPFQFEFVKNNASSTPQNELLTVTVKDANSFTFKSKKIKAEQSAKFNTPVSSEFGTWQLKPNTNLNEFVGKTIEVHVQDPDQVSDAFQKGIKVALENKDAPFVNLSFSDQVPQRGKDVLNQLMALYLQYGIEDKNKLSQKTLRFINFRIDSIRNELDSLERALQTYKTSNGLTDIISQAQSYRDINQANMKAVNDVDVQLSVVNTLDRYANSPSNSERLPAVSAALGDNTIMEMYTRLSNLLLKRDELLATTPETNPIFAPLDKQIATLKADFKDKIRALKSTLLAQKQQLNTFGGGVKSFLSGVPEKDRQFSDLKRYQESKENIYKFLLEKKEQVALRYASSVSDAEIVDDAHAGSVKWPKAGIVYGIAIFLGMAAAAGILYIRESLDDLITSRKQIEDETAVPILGELSYQESDTQIVVTEGRGKFAIGEQFRVLRTNLYHLHNNNESGRVTLFTSSVSGEGKSFVSSNLAVTLAFAKRKTIILEMDLRRPKVSVNFGLSAVHAGISDYLNEDKTNLNELIQPSGIADLDVLSCGSILPNPSELLEKGKLDEMINKLKETYDEIVIDSPPIHLVTDALIIARVADASVYVVRQNYTHKYELEFVNEINESNRFPKFTIVFNGIKRSTLKGYGYGYGYGYGGYGYGKSYYNSYSKEKVTFGSVMESILKRF